MPAVETRGPKYRSDEVPGPPLDDACVKLPAGPQTGKAYLIIEDGTLKWETA
jgi:hypothetical protein